MAKSQQVVISIGHVSILLPDETGAAGVVKTLSKGVSVFHFPGARQVEVRREELEISLTYIKPGTPITVEGGGEVVKGKIKATPKALKQPALFALMEGGGR